MDWRLSLRRVDLHELVEGFVDLLPDRPLLKSLGSVTQDIIFLTPDSPFLGVAIDPLDLEPAGFSKVTDRLSKGMYLDTRFMEPGLTRRVSLADWETEHKREDASKKSTLVLSPSRDCRLV